MSGKIAKIAERRQEQTAVTAWWGTLYQDYNFSQFPEENKGQKDDIKISFWLAQLLIGDRIVRQSIEMENRNQ